MLVVMLPLTARALDPWRAHACTPELTQPEQRYLWLELKLRRPS